MGRIVYHLADDQDADSSLYSTDSIGYATQLIGRSIKSGLGEVIFWITAAIISHAVTASQSRLYQTRSKSINLMVIVCLPGSSLVVFQPPSALVMAIYRQSALS